MELAGSGPLYAAPTQLAKGTKLPKTQGTLHIFKNSISFTADATAQQQQKIDIPILDIAQTKQSKPTAQAGVMLLLVTHQEKNYVFFFQNTDDRDRFRETLAPLAAAAKHAAPQAVATKQANGSLSAAQHDDPYKEQLRANPQLCASYEELVMRSKVLSADEFWAQRRGAVHHGQQREGFSSQRLEDSSSAAATAPVPSSGSSKVSITLTNRMIQQIFNDEPKVYRAFIENVPHKITASDFWHRYFRSKARKEAARQQMEGLVPSTADEHAAATDDKVSHHLPGASLIRKRPLYPDTAVEDVAEESLVADRSGGYGLTPNAGYRGKMSEAATSGGFQERSSRVLLQKCNQHSEVVVSGVAGALGKESGTDASVAREAKMNQVRKDWVSLPDLEAPIEQESIPLPSRLAVHSSAAAVGPSSSGAMVQGNGNNTTTYGEFAQSLARAASEIVAWFDASKQLRLPSAEAANSVAIGAAAARLEGTNTLPFVSPSQPIRILESELAEQTGRALELLKYFYACFPLAIHVGAKERATKLHAAMVAQRSGLEALRTRLPRDNPVLASAVMAKLNPLQMLLQTGIDVYDEEVLKKK